MTGRRLLVTSAVAGAQRDRLTALAGDEFVLQDGFHLDRVTDPDVLAPALAGCWGAIAGGESYSRALLERLDGLQVVARCGVGYDAIDVEAATERGVAVVTTPNTNADAVADFTLALMLAALRRVVEHDRSVRSGGWRLDGPGRDLAGATVGIVGLGLIGRTVARRLTGFGCRILAVDPAPDHEFCTATGIEISSLADMLPQLDVLTVHAPLGAGTKNLIGAPELAVLPSHAMVVNAARGGVVNEDALVDALRDGQVGGAALDVFEREPLGAEHPLTGMDNVVLAPHAAGLSVGATARMVDAAVAALRELAAGRVPQGCVNPDALDMPGVRA